VKLRAGPSALILLFMLGCNDSTTAPPTPAGTISTIMGTGLPGFTGDGDVPAQTALYNPIDLAYDPENRLVVIDWSNLRVRRVDHDGLVRTIVGTGQEDDRFVVNGTPALETPIHHAFSIALDGAGQIFLAASHIPAVMKVDVDLRVWVAAGESTAGYAGDGGPAVNALLDSPSGVSVAEEGFPVYIADTANHCIRRVDAAGVIETIAGNGTAGYSGDGGTAKNALLRGPFRVRLDREHGDLYISDTGNHRIRRIDAAGVITTVAGTGTQGYDGDGGPATLAKLNSPYDARMGPDGRLYIADTYNHRLRCVNANGVITTVAGNGTAGYQGDGGPADKAELSHPFALTIDPDGNLIVADTYNSRIRRVEHP
jgi:NHL repeat-containing protein